MHAGRTTFLDGFNLFRNRNLMVGFHLYKMVLLSPSLHSVLLPRGKFSGDVNQNSPTEVNGATSVFTSQGYGFEFLSSYLTPAFLIITSIIQGGKEKYLSLFVVWYCLTIFKFSLTHTQKFTSFVTLLFQMESFQVYFILVELSFLSLLSLLFHIFIIL